MGRIIPNQNSWIAFTTVRPSSLAAPTQAELAAATLLTKFVISINATAQGNSVPTPALDSLFETSVPGTSQATFTGDFYRDDIADTAWTTLPRGTTGYFLICRFGGTGTSFRPVATQKMEVWPVRVTTRAPGPMSSNTAQTFNLNCSVPELPAEDAIAGS